MKKNRLFLITVFLITLASLLFGCGGDTVEPEPISEQEQPPLVVPTKPDDLEINDENDETFRRYSEANELEKNKKYADALAIYESLGNYKSSAAKAQLCRNWLNYAKAAKAMNDADYYFAYKAFEALGSFQNSEELFVGNRYNYAVVCQRNGDYETAYAEFTALGDYKKSVEHAAECKVFLPSDGIIYNVENGTASVIKYKGKDTELRVAPSYEGVPVTSVSVNAFSNNVLITSVSLPDSVTELGYGAFSGCTALITVTAPGLSVIDENVFSYCTALSQVTYSQTATYIGASAFRGCTALKALVIPETVTEIGTGAFSGCTTVIETPEGSVAETFAFSNLLSVKGRETIQIDVLDAVKTLGAQVYVRGHGTNQAVVEIIRFSQTNPYTVTIKAGTRLYATDGLGNCVVASDVRMTLSPLTASISETIPIVMLRMADAVPNNRLFELRRSDNRDVLQLVTRMNSALLPLAEIQTAVWLLGGDNDRALMEELFLISLTDEAYARAIEYAEQN